MSKYIGNVDKFTLDRISGWARASATEEPLELELYLNDVSLGTFRADKFRRDLTKVKEDGRSAFFIDPMIESNQLAKNLPKKALFSIRVRGSGWILNNGEKEFVGGRIDNNNQFTNEHGAKYRLNKGSIVIPMSEQSRSWKEGMLGLVNGVRSALRPFDYELCVSYGTLLGLVRESDFIGHDDDVDCMLLVKANSMIGAVEDFHAACNLLRDYGYSVKFASNGQAKLVKGQSELDIFLAWFEADGLKLTFTVKTDVPITSILPIRTAKMLNIDVPVPNEPNVLLSTIYGANWKTPDSSFTWNIPADIKSYFLPIHNYQRGANHDYWNSYYASKDANISPLYPSQFSIFVLGFRDSFDTVVEIGCGTGRDALFFASIGIEVIASDYSESAITQNQRQADVHQLVGQVFFQTVDFSDLSQIAGFKKSVTQRQLGKRRCFYSRFFFHAVDESTEASVLRFYSEVCNYGDLIACEFRVEEDRLGAKTTDEHFRRYIDPLQFINKCYRYGFSAYYHVEGRGYANYLVDDAQVARFLLRKI